MPVHLEVAQTIAVGAFNPHIITPQWLVTCGICKDSPLEVPFAPLQQGMSFKFGDMQWQIDSRSLVVNSPPQKSNSGLLVAKVIQKLPHTPIAAIGNNLHYVSTPSDWGDAPLPVLGDPPRDSDVLREAEQVRWTGIFRINNARTEITLVKSKDGIAVLFNFHRDVKGSNQAKSAAKAFVNDKKESKRLLENLFNQGVQI